jgi:ferredoxin-type protein NapH
MQRHLNKLRWVTLWSVFAMLIILPLVSVYQIYVATHGYRLLSPLSKRFYDVMHFLTSPFTDDPATSLGAIKGTTWSAGFFGLKLSDPLAAVGQMAAALDFHWPFLVTALIPIALTVVFGRFFCGWICPATLLYEMNTNVAIWWRKAGLPAGNWHFDRRLKYGVLALGLMLSAMAGSVLVAIIYPPAIIGRELYYAIALGSFSVGAIFFALTLLFDILVARRGFCRYLCPGGALYSMLGHYRLFRIKRKVEICNDCAKCNAVCEFALDPMGDNFGQECNNCSACIAVCPTDALTFTVSIRDIPNQGPGHLSRKFLKSASDDQAGRIG